ncbi:MAG: metal-dependent hydrolase [Piscirickettsiaceae bacterium]|nr:MAG: metal-dependent hydrolase [Piscirickettsiaceae bacterium]
MQILKALNNPNCNVKLFSKIIGNDVGLTAFILKTARSLRFLTRTPPKDLESAIVRMGMKETYYLSLAFLSRSVVSSTNLKIRELLKETQQFSTKLAVISCFLAEKTRRLPANQAMLGGLFQDIGVPAILVTLEKHLDVLGDPQQRIACIDYLAPKVGEHILRQWGLDELLDVPRNRKNWALDEEQAGLPELILVARIHAMIGTKEFKACPPLFKMPAFHKFNLGELGPDNTLELLKESKEELDDIQRLLTP